MSGCTLPPRLCSSPLQLVIPSLHQVCSGGLVPHDRKKPELTHSRSEQRILLLRSCSPSWWINTQGVPREDMQRTWCGGCVGYGLLCLGSLTSIFLLQGFNGAVKKRSTDSSYASEKNKIIIIKPGMLMAINIC